MFALPLASAPLSKRGIHFLNDLLAGDLCKISYISIFSLFRLLVFNHDVVILIQTISQLQSQQLMLYTAGNNLPTDFGQKEASYIRFRQSLKPCLFGTQTAKSAMTLSLTTVARNIISCLSLHPSFNHRRPSFSSRCFTPEKKRKMTHRQ